MKLVTNIKIEGFRSIAEAEATINGSFVSLAGVNNSGKSNLLRALSLFFTDNTEPGTLLNPALDYYSDPKRRKRKQISISVSFKLPEYFHFRQGLEDTQSKLGDEFTFRRRWPYLPPLPPEPVTELKKPGQSFKPVEPLLFRQFRDLINFRYIQNRIVPTQVLREESQAFQAAVVRLLRLRGFKTDELMNKLSDAASSIVADADQAMRKSTKSIRKLEIFTPSEVAVLATFSGLRVETSTGARVPDYSIGAGSQAFMMFVLLKIIDTDYSRYFGWRQASIWAIEEPESSLHKDLEQRLALVLSEWSEQKEPRLQIFATTHSETFITAADQGLMVDIVEGKSNIHEMEIPELVQKASLMGISGVVEPVLCFPTHPVVLTEGSLDRRVLTYASQLTGVATRCRFVALPELDPTQTSGGVDSIIRYLKRNGRLVHNRAPIAPFIVLFDWDISDQKLEQARQHYGENAAFRVLRMPKEYADPKIDDCMQGIERFYPVELYQAARKKNVVDVAIDQNGCFSVQKDKLERVKPALAEMMCKTTDPSWFKHLTLVLSDVEKISLVMPEGQPILIS
jgi:hypothetical protein